jgi:two-component system, NarL family, nitrate/nitrite response regulator NarL
MVGEATRFPAPPDPLTTVYVVTPIRLYRDALTAAVERTGRLDIVGTAPDAQSAFAEIARMRPDVAVLDAAVEPVLPSLRTLAVASVTTRIVVLGLSDPELEPEVLGYVKEGAAGYVTREASLADLVEAVESAARGDLVCSARVAGALARAVSVLAAQRAPPRADAVLTVREREIANLLADGLSNKEIAGRLHIELPTVKNHVHRILGKLNVHRRGEAAARLLEGRVPTGMHVARD